MDTATLVEAELAVGGELLEALDDEKLPVKAMLWLLFPDEAEWRLLVATSQAYFDGDTEVYERIGRILSDRQLLDRLPLRKIAVVPPEHRLIMLLRRAVKVRIGAPAVHFTSNTINGIIIHGAYVYRML